MNKLWRDSQEQVRKANLVECGVEFPQIVVDRAACPAAEHPEHNNSDSEKHGNNQENERNESKTNEQDQNTKEKRQTRGCC